MITALFLIFFYSTSSLVRRADARPMVERGSDRLLVLFKAPTGGGANWHWRSLLALFKDPTGGA